jgi:hypothetical protein
LCDPVCEALDLGRVADRIQAVGLLDELGQRQALGVAGLQWLPLQARVGLPGLAGHRLAPGRRRRALGQNLTDTGRKIVDGRHRETSGGADSARVVYRLRLSRIR